MAIANGNNGFVLWVLSGLLIFVTSVGGYTIKREYNRNDNQGQRIQLLERGQERTTVTLEYISTDLSEVKDDVKALLRKP